jgi:hypothetical protein
VAILYRVVDGVKRPLTLKELREQVQTLTKSELCDFGGCGCFLGDEV